MNHPPASPPLDTATAADVLTPAQEAALARLRYAVEVPGIAILAGAAGVGKSLVLARLAAELNALGRATRGPIGPDALGRDDLVCGATLLVDDAHAGSGSGLLPLLDAKGAVVLAGRGRLLTLVARQGRLGARVRLRAIVPPFTAADTRALLTQRFAARGVPPPDADAVGTLHEIAAGIPAVIGRLADLAAVCAIDGRRLSAADVEAIHRRLGPDAG